MKPQDSDPRPVPPVRPASEDCCKGACDPCIFDVYDDALERYRADLQAWEARQVDGKGSAVIARDPDVDVPESRAQYARESADDR